MNADRTIVVWRELAYSFLPGEHFVAKVMFDREGKISESYFKF